MRVIATAVGYDNIVLRQPGEEFDMPDGAKGSWFRPAGGNPVLAAGTPDAPPAARKGRAPRTKAQEAEVAVARAQATDGASASDMT